MQKVMSLILGAAIAGTLAVVPALPACAGDCRMGYIDVPRVLEEYDEFKASRKDLEKIREDREEEFAKRYKELQKMSRDLREKASLLSESKRRDKESEIMRKSQELEEWRTTNSKELMEKEEGLVKRLESDVRKVLEKLAEKERVDFVVRRDLFLFMKKDAKDLTSATLAELRRQAKSK